MAIVRKSLNQIRAERPSVDRARLATTTEEDIRQHGIEDGENPDALLAQFAPVIPVHAVRQKLGMTQEAFAGLLQIPIGAIRNWERSQAAGRAPPDLLLKHRGAKSVPRLIEASTRQGEPVPKCDGLINFGSEFLHR